MRARFVGALFLFVLGAGALAVPASAKEVRLPLAPIEGVTQPRGMAFDQGADQLYVIDGRSEVQAVTVSATAGKFKLKLGAAETGELDFDADREQVRDALRAAICPGKECVLVPNGQGGPVPIPYEILFNEDLTTTEVEQLTCLPGTLSGGSGCSVTTTSDGVNGTITRFNADGSAANFSALGSNAIDGRGGVDKVQPAPEGLHFSSPFAVQVAVDESGGATDGDIYVTQSFNHLVDVFSSAGEFKGQLTKYDDGVSKPLGFVCGVAVDGGGNVYVSDASTGIHKYDSAGKSVDNFTSVQGPCNLAAGAGSGKESTAGSLFAVRVTEGELFKLDAANGEEIYKVSKLNTTVTVDPVSGHVLAATGGEVKEFDASGASEAIPLGSIAAGSTVAGVAVDGTPGKGGTVYLARSGVPHLDVYGPFVKVALVEAQAPSPIGVTTATLRGTISADGGPEASCHFEYLAEVTYLAQKQAAEQAGGKTNDEIAEAAFAGAESAPCEPSGPFTGSGTNPVAGKAEGLATETKYEFRLVGENENGSIPSSPLPFETFGKPVVEGGKASQVTATTALISGAVNPRGTETEAALQYVTKEQFEVEATKFEAATIVPLANLPAEVSGSGDLSGAAGVGSLTKDLSQVSGLTVTSGSFAAGQTIEGAGIPNGTTITNANTGAPPGAGTLTLSQPASQTIAGTALSAGSKTITNLSTTAGRFGPGQVISGPGIRQATTILSAQEGRLVLSKALTEEISGAALTATGPQPVSVELTGLTPDTAYVFRLVAQSETGAAEPQGKAAGFTTFGLAGPPLADDRAYEMVTPAQKAGEPYVPEAEPRLGLGGTCRHCTPGFERERMPMQSNAEGGAIAFEGDPFEAGLAPAGNEYLSRRGAGGWQTAGLSKPNYRDDTNSGTGFKAFSADLSRAVLVQVDPALSPEAPEGFANLYLREEGNEALQTAITAPPTHRSSAEFRVNYAGANAGSGAAPPFSHVIFQANDALTVEDPGIAPEAPPVGANETDLYEWSGGELHLVNVLPGNGAAAPNAVIGSGRLLVSGQGAENFDFDHAISDDGQRIFWSTVASGQVYVREGGTTTGEIPDPGKFLTASPDGSKVLLADGVLYDLEDETPTDLSAGLGGFEGIAGTSEDLSRIYFIDTEVLAPGAKEGEPNLYLWEEGEIPHEGTTSLIATLLASDNQAGISGGIGTWHAAAGNRLAQVSRDGRFLAFESRAPLSGYDSTIRDAAGCEDNVLPGGLAQCFEVFEYDAQSQTLACPSCNPSGEGPLGSSNLALFMGDGEFFAPLQNLAPEGEGRLFFESRDALVQADANGGVQDVYEWEPAGVGDCVRPGGCVALISNGRSPKDSHFIAADGDGSDVFFTTRERLVPRDKDDFLDIYDARVGGGFDEGERAPCAGEACAGPIPAPPPFEAPASSQGEGEGPVHRPACRRGFVRRGGKCVRRHRAKHKHRHHRSGQRGGRR